MYERVIEEANHWRDGPKNAEQFGIEPRARGEFRLELTAGKKLLEPQVVRGRMLFDIAPRHARQLFAFQLADRPLEWRADTTR